MNNKTRDVLGPRMKSLSDIETTWLIFADFTRPLIGDG